MAVSCDREYHYPASLRATECAVCCYTGSTHAMWGMAIHCTCDQQLWGHNGHCTLNMSTLQHINMYRAAKLHT